MSDPNFDRLRLRAKEKHDRELAAATAKIGAAYVADLGAIDRTEALNLEVNASPVAHTTPEPGIVGHVASKAAKLIGPAEATRNAIGAQISTFTIDDLDQFISKNHPDSGITKTGISSAIAKMVGKHVIIVKPKAGRGGATYRRADATVSAPVTEQPTLQSVL